ncbi:MAG TPA: VWA domain-containing protein [Candidatus Udaeobacter sp.]|nr:VWA domain-containing protein [Candidatus Udaeobacter sp.]
MTFGVPQWLWGLPLVPLLIALFVRSEQRGLKRLQEFVSARLLPQLAATVNRPRRRLRFSLQVLGFALAIVSLAQPRWGYTFEDVKRKGLDLLIAVDTSRSMLSNDVQPNRLDRVRLAIQDLINQLQGDRVGLIAFAGRAFLQAPLTIDYDAVVEAVNDLDTKTIPEGGTNISSAITLATQSFGKSAMGNRALVIFTDGEELSGDAVKTAKEAADAGVRIFTVGVGTPQGSLIPVTGDDGQTGFVKDSAGQVVKSKLDDKRLREIAQATGGFYLHLENGPRTMQQIQNEGLAKMQAAEMDVRLSRRPIERYEWPLGLALIALALSILIPERKSATGRIRRGERARQRAYAGAPAGATAAAFLVTFLFSSFALATTPGLDAYRSGKFEDAYSEFQQTLKSHPQSRAEDKLQFDSGAAAYKLKDYTKAMESFSQALLSRDTGLQSKGHYNLGNTLYERGESQKSDDKKLSDWTNALEHYEQTLKLEPQNKEAKDNYDYVKRKIDELKNKKQQQPSPSPSPQQKNQQDKQNKQNQQKQQQQQQNQQQQQQQQQQQNQQQQGQGQQQQKDQKQSKDQQSQSQEQSGNQKDQQQKNDQAQAKNEPQKKQQQPGESPSPSPNSQNQQGQQPSPSPGEQRPEESPSPGEGENETPSPSPGEGEDENANPSPTPAQSPQKKFAGDVKGAGENKSQKPPDKNAQVAEGEPEKEGQMSERQAEALLESMKDEEARVQLDERRATRRVYKDW